MIKNRSLATKQQKFHKQFKLFCALIALCAAIVKLQGANAAPVLIPSLRMPTMLGVPLTHVAAFTIELKSSDQSFPKQSPDHTSDGTLKYSFAKRIPIQVQELNNRNTLEFKGHSFLVHQTLLKPDTTDQSLRRTAVTYLHRLVLNERDFNPCAEVCLAAAKSELKKVCPAGTLRQVLKVSLEWRAGVAFVVECAEAFSPWEAPAAVEVSLENRTLASRLLRYTYAQKNHMLLEDFSLKKDVSPDVLNVLSSDASSTQNSEEFKSLFTPLLRNSEMHLYAKPRYFFPLHFTGDDVRSELSRVQIEPLSAAGQLTFFLDVLSFKISLNLLSEVSMFEDAIHVPVLLNLPVDGSMLRAGSGVYYGFQFAQGMTLNSVTTDLPRLQVSQKTIPFASTRIFEVQNKDFSIAVGMHMPAEFEDMGFAPALALPEDLKNRDFPKVKSDFGIFYDITRLKRGTHRFDLWFYVGNASDEKRVKTFARDGVVFNVEALRH